MFPLFSLFLKILCKQLELRIWSSSLSCLLRYKAHHRCFSHSTPGRDPERRFRRIQDPLGPPTRPHRAKRSFVTPPHSLLHACNFSLPFHPPKVAMVGICPQHQVSAADSNPGSGGVTGPRRRHPSTVPHTQRLRIGCFRNWCQQAKNKAPQPSHKATTCIALSVVFPSCYLLQIAFCPGRITAEKSRSSTTLQKKQEHLSALRRVLTRSRVSVRLHAL